MINLAQAYKLLDTKWPCDADVYPALAYLKDEKLIVSFKLHHALGHLHKTTGKMESLLEKVDHGEDISVLKTEEVTELVGKMFIDAMEIAKVLDVDSAKLEEWIEKFLHEK